MRLWSLHPRYLDPKGLVALWREALLARAVLRGETQGYRHHPQLARFLAQPAPVSAINAYLLAVHAEATARGYAFDRSKIGPVRKQLVISVTSGQMVCEWQHLLQKLSGRHPGLHARWCAEPSPECHPLFRLCEGPAEAWERRRPGPGDEPA
jgi:hypothetical protein